MNDTNIFESNRFVDALERYEAGTHGPGDALLLVTKMDEWMERNNVTSSYLEMMLELPAGTFEILDDLALAERAEPR